jgi:pyruvate kinase
LNIARLNFSHADFTGHADRIARIRAAEKATGRRVAIMADLPGPKMRVGKIEPEPIQLLAGESFTLTRENVVGDARRFSMSFDRLPDVGRREVWRSTLPQRRPGRTGGRARGGQRRPVQGRDRR